MIIDQYYRLYIDCLFMLINYVTCDVVTNSFLYIRLLIFSTVLIYTSMYWVDEDDPNE